MNDELPEKAWKLINRAADLLRSDAINVGAGELEKTTASQQNVLGAVYMHSGDGMMVKDIAAELDVTRGAVSQTVESLVKLGMLERVQSDEDRRAVFVRATPKGMKIREKLLDRINPLLREVLAGVSVRDRTAFVTVLELLVQRLTEMNRERKEVKSVSARSSRLPVTEGTK